MYTAPVDVRVGTFVGEANVLDAEVTGDHATCALGVIPVRNNAADGRGVVLIRPEQLQLVDPDAPGAATGRVIRCTYYGPSAKLDVQVHHMGVTLTARVSTFDRLPNAGSSVVVVIRGQAGAFLDDTPAASDDISHPDGSPHSAPRDTGG